MDPLTVGLVIAAIAAGIGIKRAAAPPVTSLPPEAAGAPEAPSFYGIPPHAFGGGLREPVTHRSITGERPAEADRGGGGEEGADIKVTLTPGAQGREIASEAPDVAGTTSGRGQRPPTLYQWVTPLTGRYVGQSFLVPAGTTSPLLKPLGGPVPG